MESGGAPGEIIERRFGTQLKRTLRLLQYHYDLLFPRHPAGPPPPPSTSSSSSSIDPYTELPQAWSLLTQARAALVGEYVRQLTTEADASTKELGNRLWLLFYKEIEPLQAKLRGGGAGRGGGSEVANPAQEARDKALWKQRLEAVMMEGAVCLTDALQQLRAAAKDNQEDAVSLMVALGDLARYAGRLVDASGDTAKTMHCLEQAEDWYTQALEMRPGFGRAYNQLAIVATLKTKRVEDHHVVQAAVDYSRAFLAHGEPFAARENLVALLDRWRRKHDLAANAAAQAKSLEMFKAVTQKKGGGGAVGSSSNRSGASSSSIKEQRTDVQQSLLKVLHMLYARVDLDNVPQQARTLARQLATLVQSIQRQAVTPDEAVLRGLKTLCLQTVLLTFGALYDRAEVAGLLNQEEEETEEGKEVVGKPGADLRGALALAMEVGLVMANEGEVLGGGWDESRGPALLLVLGWLRANQRWLSNLPGDRTVDVVRAAQRLLLVKGGGGSGGKTLSLTTTTTPQVSAKELQQTALSQGERLVVGLRGFNLPSKRAYMLARRHLSQEGVNKAQEKARDIARCRIFLEAWEKEAGLKEKRKKKKEEQQQQQLLAASSSSSSSLSMSLATEMAALTVGADPLMPPALPTSSSTSSFSSLPASITPPEINCPSCGQALEAELLEVSGANNDVSCEFCGHQFPPPPSNHQEKEEEEVVEMLEGSPIRDPLPLPMIDAPPVSTKPRGMLLGVDLSHSLPSSSTLVPATPSSSSSYQRLAPPGLDTTSQQDSESRLIVIDAANVAMRHGMKKNFSCQGIALALDYFRVRGHRAIAFLPDHYLDFKRVGELKRTQKAVGGIRVAQLPDNVALLHTLQEAGLLIGTPPQDHDDNYIISYALQMGGYIVTNDMYRDHVEKAAEKEKTRRWMKTHLMSYTFVQDAFLPNPDFRFVD